MSAHFNTSEYLNALPVGTVIRAADGEVLERQAPDLSHRGWLAIGSELDVHVNHIAKPARIIYDPREAPDAP